MGLSHFSCPEPSPFRNCEYFEILIPQDPFCFGARNPITIDKDGFVHVPNGPGLGVEIDFDLLDNNLICRV